jgi:hypothetical protein
MAKNLHEEIRKKLYDFGEKIIIDLGVELVLKGRTNDANKSRLISQAQVQVDDGGLNILMPAYWKYVEWGVSPQNIPYNPHKRTGAGKSQYINALLSWLVSKGKDSSDKRTKSLAFAIAATQKKKGNPINKQKLHFINATLIKNQSKWRRELEKIIGKSLQNFFTVSFPTKVDNINY